MSPADIGLTLRKARLARGLTLEQAAQAVHIKPRYLQALEEGRWEDLPSRAQGRGFLRLYADFLGEDSDALLHRLEAQAAPAPDAQGEARTDAAASPPAAAPADGATPPTAPADEDPALPIFAEIGAAFCQQREQLSITLQEAERYTHVKRHYLQAIEEGRLDDLPSPVQGRGMLLHYARFLQLAPDPLLLRFAEALQARHRQRQQPQRRTVRAMPMPAWWPKARAFVRDRLLIWAVVLVSAVVVGFGVWQVGKLHRAQAPQPTPPNVVDVLFPSATPTPTVAQPTPTPTPPVAGGAAGADVTAEPTDVPQSSAPIQVYLVAQHRAWVRVIADGDVVFQGVVVPGASYDYAAQTRLEVLTGDGAALQVFYNQQNLGLLGRFGEVVDRVFTISGVQTPTPTVSPTPTITPTPTVTSTPTATPTPTPTAQTLP